MGFTGVPLPATPFILSGTRDTRTCAYLASLVLKLEKAFAHSLELVLQAGWHLEGQLLQALVILMRTPVPRGWPSQT